MTSFRHLVRTVIPLRASVFDSFRKKLEHRLSTLDSIESQIDSLDNTMSSHSNSISEQLTSVSSTLLSTQTTLSNLKAEIDLLHSEINKLDSQLSALEQKARQTTASLQRDIQGFERHWRSFTFGYDYERTRLPEERKNELRRWFKMQTGKDLNLEHPRTFNEKIQWLKLFDAENKDRKAVLADKIACRREISNLIGEERLVKLYGVWQDPVDISFSDLPDSFILKCNHGSGWNRIISDKSACDIAAVKAELKSWLSKDYSYMFGYELHYGSIEPKAFAEEYLPHSESFYELQIWCFNGSPEFISLIREPHGVNEKASYSPQWKRLPFVSSLPEMKETVAKPECLEELLGAASKIANGFAFARIDFYLQSPIDWKFSEVTFTPASGVVGWNPASYDLIMGNKLKLPKTTEQ